MEKAHVPVVPYPGQGHVNPMIQFCWRLISKGLKATLVKSVFLSKSMSLGSSVGPVSLDVISDGFDDTGFPPAGSFELYLERLKTDGSRTLAELITRYRSTPCPIDCVVYEPFLPWALDVAKDFGLIGAAFFTQPCAVDYIYYNIQHGKISVALTPVSVPGLPLLEHRDMPSFVGVPGSYPAYFEMLLNQFSNTDKADFVLINTFYELEREAVDTMSKVCPVLTIGPTIPSIYLDNRIEDDDSYYIDLFPLHSSISMDWLKSKPPRSVVYVAFGSISNLSDQQMQELSSGLKKTGYYFLLVIRDSDKTRIPKSFYEDLGDKGLVVSWSPQVKILANEAVGCFLTHCGWNSTIESLSFGVPMVAMPQWTDQPPNAKLVEDVWKVGVRVDVDEKGIVWGEEIERRVREVMEGDRAEEMRRNCEKWREAAAEAVGEGGTSDVNISRFVWNVINSKV